MLFKGCKRKRGQECLLLTEGTAYAPNIVRKKQFPHFPFPVIKLCGAACGDGNEGIHIVEILVFRNSSLEEIATLDGIVKAVKVGVCIARILDFGVIDTKLLTELLYHSILGLLGEEHIHVDTVTGIDE